MLLGCVITVDYGADTWPGGRWRRRCWGRHARPFPGLLRAREDARLVYLSYTLIAELRYFEQVSAGNGIAIRDM